MKLAGAFAVFRSPVLREPARLVYVAITHKINFVLSRKVYNFPKTRDDYASDYFKRRLQMSRNDRNKDQLKEQGT